MKSYSKYILIWCILGVTGLAGCKDKKPSKEQALFQTYCASCHIAPDIDALPKQIWNDAVLPDMAARMDIDKLYMDPDQIGTGFRPKITLENWIVLKNYIVSLAPDSLPDIPLPNTQPLTGFIPEPVRFEPDQQAYYTFMQYEEAEHQLVLGDIYGRVTSYHFPTRRLQERYKGNTPVTWYNQMETVEWITEVGILDPSEEQQGKLIAQTGEAPITVADGLHRPVHHLVADLNNDGVDEIVVAEFGNEHGALSLLTKEEGKTYTRSVLLKQPGCIRTVAQDMNGDGKLDLVSLTSQGNESITILYQKEPLEFEATKAIEFSSVYGSSWFELVDYNQDGYLDIITVNGDNADKSYVHKPYHGMRIHLNDGNNNFTETYFYPLNGATRSITKDFDQDGDLDIALLSTFPDYERARQLVFVYLENQGAKAYNFQARVLERPNQGRWFLMEAADVDQDGDQDIVLSTFPYAFTPVPEELATRWKEDPIDLLFLENTLH